MFYLLLGLSAAVASPALPSRGPQPQPGRTCTVVLDAGHGGANFGARAHDGQWEKDVTLALTTRLRTALIARVPRIDVRLTREGDQTIALAQRVAFANDAKGDLFVSIHTNASPKRDQLGFETYVLTPERAVHAGQWDGYLRDQERRETGSAGQHSMTVMVRQLASAAQRQEALRLASSIQGAQVRRFPKRIDRGVKAGNLDVLYGVRMPAVLFEVGFIDNAEEGPWVTSPQGQEAIVGALLEGILEGYQSCTRGHGGGLHRGGAASIPP